MAKKIPAIVKQIQKHKLQEVDYSQQKNISFSQLQMFDQCPYKWSMVYKAGIKIYQPSIHTVFGKAFHETIQHYLTVLYETSGAEADRIDLDEYLQDKLLHHYQDELKGNSGVHFSTAEELKEFWEDGCAIFDSLKKKRGGYFSKKGWYLVGDEIPITLTPHVDYPNTIYKGYLDLVLYHEPTDTFEIIDFKTSKSGWNDYAKKDEMKQMQLILYKDFFHKQFNIPLDSINIKFLIVRRKAGINPYTEGQISRFQEFIPASGRVKVGQARKAVERFITECFTEEGQYRDKVYEPNPSKHNCRFCPFKDKPDVCKSAILK
jgi:hypothetical protein